MFKIMQEEEGSLRERINEVLRDIKNNYDHERAKPEGEKRKKQAIVVNGKTLILIDKLDDLRKNFVEASTFADVVLACRVSPK